MKKNAPKKPKGLSGKIFKSIIVFILSMILINFIESAMLIRMIKNILQWAVLIAAIYIIFKIFIGSKISIGSKINILPKEVKSGGGEGIIFGKSGISTISKAINQEGHVAVIGGSGTGKSASVSIPTLLSWNGAAVIIDIKKELHSKTSAYREKEYGKVYVFDPDDPNCDCYDPLEQVKGIDGANDLAKNLIPTPEKDPYWNQCAQGVFASAILDGINKNQAFGEICERVLITEPNHLIQELFNSQDSRVKMLCSAVNGIAENTLTGVFSTLRTYLLTFASDQKIRNATRKTSWTPEVLEKGSTVYLRINERMIEQYRGVISAIVSQMFRYLSSREEKQEPAILMLLDELPRLGKVEGLIEALATLRSRNVHIMPMVQSLADLDRHYGQDERKIILDNCAFKLVLGCGDYDTQKYFSDLSGTEKVWQRSYNRNWIGIAKGSTDSLNEEKIIKPERFGQLKQDRKAIVFGYKEPLELDKLFWFESLKFRKIVESNNI